MFSKLLKIFCKIKKYKICKNLFINPNYSDTKYGLKGKKVMNRQIFLMNIHAKFLDKILANQVQENMKKII